MAESFFQSAVFGEFQKKIPYRGKFWDIRKGESHCLAVRQKLRFGLCWLWVPYGPEIMDASGPRLSGGQERNCSDRKIGEIFEELGKIAKEEKAVFARIEAPCQPEPVEGCPSLPVMVRQAHHDIHPAPRRFTPEHTLILDLSLSEDELLAQMKPKGRYNISVARKNGVMVDTINGNEFNSVPGNTQTSHFSSGVKIRPGADFEEFYKILRTTGERDAFGIHPKFFYEKLLETFGENAALLLGKKDDRVIAGIIVIFYKNTATYYYGASDYGARNLMAPYLLQWEAIREAKKRGMKEYDFLGISPPAVTVSLSNRGSTLRQAHHDKHPWAGVTDFKKKFGGREKSYPPAFDIIYRPWLYRLATCRQ